MPGVVRPPRNEIVAMMSVVRAHILLVELNGLKGHRFLTPSNETQDQRPGELELMFAYSQI